MFDIAGVEAGRRKARLAPEEIELSDYHGLIDLLVEVANGLDKQKDQLPAWLDDLYERERHLLA